MSSDSLDSADVQVHTEQELPTGRELWAKMSLLSKAAVLVPLVLLAQLEQLAEGFVPI
jgi:hypothetical protein